MGRIRTMKPEMYLHEGLFDLEQETSLPIRHAWGGLFTQCDREGRFEWRPRRLKAAILPYDDLDFSRVLDALLSRGFIVKYACPRVTNGRTFGVIPTWDDHQFINNRESPSVLPDPHSDDCEILEGDLSVNVTNTSDACPTRAPRVPHGDTESLGSAQGERKGTGTGTGTGTGKEGNGKGNSSPPNGDGVNDGQPAKRKRKTYKYPATFEVFWKLCGKGGKYAALGEWQKAIERIMDQRDCNEPQAVVVIRDAADAYMDAAPWSEPRFRPDTEKWLRGGHYDINPEEWKKLKDNGKPTKSDENLAGAAEWLRQKQEQRDAGS